MPVGVFASAVDDGLNIIACYTDPDSGYKTVVIQQDMKGHADEIVKIILDKLLSAMNENIADGFRV